MAGEIIKTDGIVLAIHPWSRTSHIVTWLTPDHGCVTTLVKGAVRPKSAFLGQYDLFYTCDLLYYARARGDMHALRETTPRNLRESLRGRWRETAIAGYAAGLVKDLAPANGESAAWFEFMSSLLDRLETHSLIPLLELVRLEMDVLRLAGWSPDFSTGRHSPSTTGVAATERAPCASPRAPWRSLSAQMHLAMPKRQWKTPCGSSASSSRTISTRRQTCGARS